jgi:hypothetical protein
VLNKTPYIISIDLLNPALRRIVGVAPGYSTLKFADPLGAVTTLPISALEEFPIERISARVRPSGDTIQMKITTGAKAKQWNFAPRAIVQLWTPGAGSGVSTELSDWWYPRAIGRNAFPASEHEIGGQPLEVEFVGLSKDWEDTECEEYGELNPGLQPSSIAGKILVHPAAGHRYFNANATTTWNAVHGGSGQTYRAIQSSGFSSPGAISFGYVMMDKALASVKALLQSLGGPVREYGVDPYGITFFMVTPSSTVMMYQNANGWKTNTPRVQADAGNLVTRIRWDLGEGNTQGNANGFPIEYRTPDSVTYLSDSGIALYDAPKTHGLKPGDELGNGIQSLVGAPAGFRTYGTIIASYYGGTSDSSPILNRVTDTSDYSYCVVETTNSSVTSSDLEIVVSLDSVAGRPQADLIGFKINVKPNSSSAAPASTDEISIFVSSEFNGSVFRYDQIIASKIGSLPEFKGTILIGDRIRIPTGVFVVGDKAILKIHARNSGGSFTYDVESVLPLFINRAVLDKAALDYYRIPKKDALKGDRTGLDFNLYRYADFTNAVGATPPDAQGQPITEIEWVIAPEGEVTRYVTGPRVGYNQAELDAAKALERTRGLIRRQDR